MLPAGTQPLGQQAIIQKPREGAHRGGVADDSVAVGRRWREMKTPKRDPQKAAARMLVVPPIAV